MYVEFKYPIARTSVNNLFQRPFAVKQADHWEAAVGSHDQNKDYVTKDGEFEEWGMDPQ